jgi:hypothetical protein
MPLTSLLQCVHPIARDIGLALLAVLFLLALARLVLRKRFSWIPFAVCSILIALAVWLGAYAVSPLGFSTGRTPLLTGFRITRPQRPEAHIAPREVILLAAGAPTAIEPQLLPVPVECIWSSSNGGVFDDPASCDTDYSPGRGAGFDVLRISVRPACGVPSTVGAIRVSILP